jgi:serine/threonine-protein kinase
MKRCPKCDRLFEENSLNFCRGDGTLLVSGSLNEAATVFFPVQPLHSRAKVLPEATSSIAVLPFENLTPDPANEYFCVGLAEELVRALTRIENLRVAAAAAAFSFKGKNVDIRDIGRALNVEVVLEGSIRRSKTKMRITVQLVSAHSGYQLWSERYDRELSEISGVKGEIALAVVKALEVTLRAPEQSAIAKRHTENTNAHELYLKGRFHACHFTAEEFRTGIEYLNQAIAEDPEYALAYAGLADAYHHASCVLLTPAESLVQVKAAAEKALALDENLAEAHALLAIVAANYDRMPEAAEKGFKRALELAPNSLLAHQWYGCFLMTQGRLAAAIGEFCRARELDPLSPILSVLMSLTYFFARQPNKALKHARKAVALDNSFWLGYWSAGLAHEQSGHMIEALDQLEKASECHGSPWITAVRARVYARLDKTEIAEAMLNEVNKSDGTHWVAPYLVATVYFALDQMDRGFEWLEKAFDEYDENLKYMAVDPVLDSCRSDPRFLDLLRRAGLDQSNAKTHFVVPVSGDCLASGSFPAISASFVPESHQRVNFRGPTRR